MDEPVTFSALIEREDPVTTADQDLVNQPDNVNEPPLAEQVPPIIISNEHENFFLAIQCISSILVCILLVLFWIFFWTIKAFSSVYLFYLTCCQALKNFFKKSSEPKTD